MSLVKSKRDTLEGDITLEQDESIIKDATSKNMSKIIKRRLANKNSGTREESEIMNRKCITDKRGLKKIKRKKIY